jgi:hypothetical protein
MNGNQKTTFSQILAELSEYRNITVGEATVDENPKRFASIYAISTGRAFRKDSIILNLNLPGFLPVEIFSNGYAHLPAKKSYRELGGFGNMAANRTFSASNPQTVLDYILHLDSFTSGRVTSNGLLDGVSPAAVLPVPPAVPVIEYNPELDAAVNPPAQ